MVPIVAECCSAESLTSKAARPLFAKLEVWSGGVEEGDHEFEMIQFETGRNCWMEYYDAVNPGISALCMELNEVLGILTHTKYLQIFDITEDEMKKLLKRS